eukprot:8400362-Pyramimonas_sp.AAC.1
MPSPTRARARRRAWAGLVHLPHGAFCLRIERSPSGTASKTPSDSREVSKQAVHALTTSPV